MEHHHNFVVIDERVLGRDLRTIKTRVWYRTTTTNKQFVIKPCGWVPTTTTTEDDKTKFNVPYYCHNQYSTSTKRLNDLASCDHVKWRFTYLRQFLLLFAYLALLASPPGADAAPFRHLLSANIRMDLKSLIAAHRSANTALTIAKHLKNECETKTGIPAEVLKSAQSYDWLPKVPQAANELENHLEETNLPELSRIIYRNVLTIRDPINHLITDIPKNEKDFQAMRGLLDNILEELNYALSQYDPNSDVPSPIVDELPKELQSVDHTVQTIRDWFLISNLVEVLEYSVAVFQHYQVPLENT